MKDTTIKNVDEVDMAERAFLVELITTILKLSYTSCCEEFVWKTVNSSCEGCQLKLPSQSDHLCVMMEEEQAWNLFYDDAMQLVETNRVWELATSV